MSTAPAEVPAPSLPASEEHPVQSAPAGVRYLELFVLPATLVIVILLVWAEAVGLPGRIFLRYLAILPVMVTAYQQGMAEGQLLAAFFSVAFLPELWTVVLRDGSALLATGNLIFVVVIHLVAYISTSYGKTTRRRQALDNLAWEWSTLLASSMDMDQVIRFILMRSKHLLNAEFGVLLYRHPLQAQWQVVEETGVASLPGGDGGEDEQNLAHWLIAQEEPVFMHYRERRYRTFLMVPSNDQSLRSLLSYPLWNRDGTLQGILVVFNLHLGHFERPDMQSLADMVAGGEKALEYAGVYARTDYALAKRVRQLGAIQRTVRELNQTLDITEMAVLALNCALEITDAEAGLISLQMKGFAPINFSLGEVSKKPVNLQEPGSEDKNALLVGDQAPLRIPLEETKPEEISPQVSSRLLAPIRHSRQTLGMMIVESASPKIFKEASRHVLSILTDHLANALENVRLFKEIQAEQARAQRIIQSIEDGLLTVDSDGKVLALNPAAERLTGWAQVDEVGGGLDAPLLCQVLACQHTPGESCPLLEAVSERRKFTQERLKLTTPQGIQRVLSINTTPLPVMDGAAPHLPVDVGAVVLLRDITHQDEIDRGQRELIAAISHELRAPLTVMRAITETMLADSTAAGMEPNSLPYARFLKSLMVQTGRLDSFADRILDVYRVETGQLRLEQRPLPIGFLVEQLVQQWQTAAPQRVFELSLPDQPLWISADEKSVESVLNNLIDNAIKYSPAITSIRIRVEASDDGFVTCVVEDEGQGIPPSAQPYIFDRFYRVDGGDAQKVYGHGLGLYIAKSLVDAMQGRIWVVSRPGSGSRFYVSLPLMEEFS